MTDLELMERIYAQAGAAIAAAVKGTALPESLLAALIANETGEEFASGGVTAACQAKRFEPAVLLDLWNVLLSRKPSYGSIDRVDLLRYVAKIPAIPVNVPATIPADAPILLDGLANSWGLTQIMGYHALDPALFPSQPFYASGLQDAMTCLSTTVKMLVEFGQRFDLQASSLFADLFRCWNSGRPDGKTFDPAYASNGVRRMNLYQQIDNSPASPGG